MKIIPFTVAHTYMALIWQYLPPVHFPLERNKTMKEEELNKELKARMKTTGKKQ